MFKILRYFKDNRIKSIIVLIVIGLIIIFYNALEQKIYKNNSSSSIYTTAIVQNTNNSFDNNASSNNSTIMQNVNSEEKAIELFVSYCNNAEIGKAYNLLSDECKNVLYKKQEDFYEKYYKVFWQQQRKYKVEKYNDNIYKLTIMNDPLATGKVDNNSFIEYITVNKINGTYKINIASLIKYETLNMKETTDYFDINVVDKAIYMNYEIYTIEILNTSLVNISLTDLKNDKEIFIQDTDKNNFYLSSSEYTEENLTIPYKEKCTIQLKFNKKYTKNNKDTKKIVFKNMKLINREYYDRVISKSENNKTTNNITYEKKHTTYPTEYFYEINLQ
ncbi:MAG: hypothetical protein J6A89_03915 [Clostridia bacterium]|nr:hypothetical protein [Clostridia bacterium]